MDKIKQIGFKAGEKPRRPVIQEDTSASKSYASIAYGISEGEIVGLIDGAGSVYLDGTPVMSVSGDVNIPDVKIQERNGTNDQTHLEGFPAVVNEKQYNNIEMLQNTPFVHYINDTNLDAVGIRFTFGALQRTNPDNGDVSGITLEYAIDVQADGQGYQELLRTSIIGKYSAGYQRYHRIELPQADEGWEVRIRRITPNTTSTYIADKMYLDAVAEILDVKMRYPNTALIGLKFDSERFSNIPKVDFRMRGKVIRVPANYDPVARTYAQSGAGTTNGIWNGQFKMAYTTNPAWIFYDLVLNRRYGLGNRIDASMLDKWSLYSIAQYCDVMVPDGEGGTEPRFTCNVYINSRFEAYDCLMQLAGVFRGIMYWSGTAIIAGCDRPQDPVFTYTRANIVGEFNYSGTRTKDRHSVVMVSFDDPRNNYKTEKEVVSDRKAISEVGIRTKDLAAFACTSRGQAQRAGKWALFKERFETRIVTFALGMDGYIAPVGRIIEIADPLLAGRAIGGRIAAVSADKTMLTLDRDTEVKVGDRLVLNNEEGKQESRQVTSISGRSVTVAVAFESPAVQHVWAIDSDDLQLMRFTVISVAENRSQDSINFTVTALQHEPALHEAADYSAYVDRNTYSAIDITTQKAPTEVLISSINRINQGIDLTDLVISWKQAENAVKYHVQWRRDDGNWIRMPLQYGNQVTVENIYHGVYEAKVVAINAADVNSLPASSAPTPINSKFAEPAVLASLTATGILLGVELNWEFPLYGAQNAAFVEIYWALNSDKSDSKLLGSYAYPTSETTINGLSPHLTLYFQARLVDRNGVASGFTQWVTATVEANPEKLLDILSGHISEGTLDQALQGKIDSSIVLAGDANNLASQASAAATNAQSVASQAATDAQEAANAVVQEALDRAAAIQNGLTQVTTDYRAGDAVVLGELVAYKTSNDSAVATVVQKAESAVAAGSTNSQAITELTGQVQAINDTKLDASVISNYYTKGQADDKSAEIAAGQITAFEATLSLGGGWMDVGREGAQLVIESGAGTIEVIDRKLNHFKIIATSNGTLSAYIAACNNSSAIPVGTPYVMTGKVRASRSNLYDCIYLRFNQYSPESYVYGWNASSEWVSFKASGVTNTQDQNSIYNIIGALVPNAIAGDWVEFKDCRVSVNSDSLTATNAQAIQTTTAEVARVNGVVTSQASSLSLLQSSLSDIDTKANTAINNAATAQQAANTAVTANQANASSLTKLESTFESSRDSDSLAADYLMRDVNQWQSIYGYDLSSYFTTVTDGKISNTVFRKPSTIQECWNYSRSSVSNTRKYKLSMWVRCDAASLGNCYFTVMWGNAAYALNPNQYTYEYAGEVPKTNTWTKLEKVWDLTTQDFTQLRFGFAIGHASAGGLWEMQGFKVEAVIAEDDVDDTLATAAALTLTNTEVARVNGEVVSTALIAQNLQASLDNTNANISNNYYTKSSTDQAIASATTQLSSSFDTSIKNVGVIKDTRNDNQPPSWYWTNHPRITEKEFKYSANLGISQAIADTLGVLETVVPWFDPSGGAIQQKFTWTDGAYALTRYSISSSAWSAWASAINEVKAIVNTKLDASVISNYYTKAEADNVVAGKIEQFGSKVLTSNENLFKGDITTIPKSPGPGITTFNWDGALVFDCSAGNSNYVSLDLSISPYTINNNSQYGGPVTVSMDYMIDNGTNAVLPDFYFGHGYQTFESTSTEPPTPQKWVRIFTTLYTDANLLLSSPHLGLGAVVGRIFVRNLKVERGTLTQYSADIKETTKSINGIEAIKTVTIDNNGVMSGYGLISQLKNGQVTSAFGVNADTFYIGSPSSNKKPFVQKNDWSEINGVWVPPGTYIDTAYIANTTIKLAQIDTASIGSLSALSAVIGHFKSAPSGPRIEIADGFIRVYDESGLVVEIGDLI